MRFLYIDPIKQGLKQIGSIYASDIYKFLYIDPIKQGLKPFPIISPININESFYT